MEALTRNELDEVLRDYVCSGCWGPLSFDYIKGEWFAKCLNCGDAMQGYVSKHFAERRKTESERELIEAQHNLAEVLGLKPPRQSIAQNISDLGF